MIFLKKRSAKSEIFTVHNPFFFLTLLNTFITTTTTIYSTTRKTYTMNGRLLLPICATIIEERRREREREQASDACSRQEAVYKNWKSSTIRKSQSQSMNQWKIKKDHDHRRLFIEREREREILQNFSRDTERSNFKFSNFQILSNYKMETSRAEIRNERLKRRREAARFRP